MMRSVQSPARKPGTRSTGRPSPGGTPRPRNTGSRSRAGLLQALAPPHERPDLGESDPREALRRHIQSACATWAGNPALYRHLPHAQIDDPEANRTLAESLAAADALRPGCSIKEAEDVVGALTSFAVFDRLHKDGRRPAAAVGEILTRLATAILA